MLVFEEQQRYIAWHTDVAAERSIVPLVVLDAMEFLEDIKEVGEVF